MKRIKMLTAVAATLCCLASTTQAIVVIPGGSGNIAAVVPLDVTATVIAPALPSAFVADTLRFSGTLTSTVLQEGAAFNPLGGYTFVYKVANDAVSADALHRLTVNNWTGAAPGPVRLENTGAGTLADMGDWTASAFVIGFDWNTVLSGGAGLIAPGTFGEVVVRTSLQTWNFSTASVIDGGTAGLIRTYAVPEPTTMIAGALLLLPFGASTLRFMRKNRTA